MADAVQDKQHRRQVFFEFLLFVLYKLSFQLFAMVYYPIYHHDDIYIEPSKIVIGWIIYLTFVWLIERCLKDDFWAISYKFLFILGGMTTILVFEIRNIPVGDFVKATLYWALLLVAFCHFQKKKNRLLKVKLPTNKRLFYYIFAFCAVFTLALSGVYAGFRMTLSFEDVYEYRMEMRVAGMPSIVRYLFTFIGSTILPMCFAYFLSQKKKVWVALAAFFAVMIFSINGMKTWLVIYLMIVMIFIAILISKRYLISDILLFMIFMTGGCALTLANGNFSLTALLDRIIFIPSSIGYNYINFFDDNHFLFLRESILRFLGSPYPINSGFYIVGGDLADAATTSRANNGLWGDAYANFAIVGILVYPFMLGWIMKLLKSSMFGLDFRFALSMSSILLWSAINSSFFTWLLSGGVIITVFLARMVERKCLEPGQAI